LVAGAAQGQPALPKVAIEHPDGYYAIDALESHFKSALSEQNLRRIADSHSAIWVMSYSGAIPRTGANYCWVAVGLTEVPPKGRNARFPTSLFSGTYRANARGSLNDSELNGCMNGALGQATKNFAKATSEEQDQKLERTREKGSQKAEPPSPNIAQLYSRGTTDAGDKAIFNAITPEFRKAFDYRRLTWFVATDSARFDDAMVCVSVAGVSARPPEDRTPRVPGYRRYVMREVPAADAKEKGAEAQCRDEVALSAVTDGLEEPWDAKGLLDKFSFAQEASVQPVTGVKRKDPRAEATAKAAQFRRTLKVGSDSHCGLVIEVRGPIAKVQAMIGEVWLKTAQLYPKGAQDCRFVNGVYQEP